MVAYCSFSDENIGEAPHAVVGGKKFRVELVDMEDAETTVAANILWLEKRNGVEMTGNIQGPRGNTIQSALANLRVKIDGMARGEK